MQEKGILTFGTKKEKLAFDAIIALGESTLQNTNYEEKIPFDSPNQRSSQLFVATSNEGESNKMTEAVYKKALEMFSGWTGIYFSCHINVKYNQTPEVLERQLDLLLEHYREQVATNNTVNKQHHGSTFT